MYIQPSTNHVLEPFAEGPGAARSMTGIATLEPQERQVVAGVIARSANIPCFDIAVTVKVTLSRLFRFHQS